jgi:hypothetical protein
MGLMGRGMPGRRDRGTKRDQDASETVTNMDGILLVKGPIRAVSDDESCKEIGDGLFDKRLQ